MGEEGVGVWVVMEQEGGWAVEGEEAVGTVVVDREGWVEVGVEGAVLEAEGQMGDTLPSSHHPAVSSNCG